MGDRCLLLITHKEDYCYGQMESRGLSQKFFQSTKMAQESIAKLNLKGNESILDIGCKDGKVTAEIASYVPNGSVLAIDSSSEMIDFA